MELETLDKMANYVNYMIFMVMGLYYGLENLALGLLFLIILFLFIIWDYVWKVLKEVRKNGT